MQGSLGEKIGEGAYSEAYAWAPGQVVKLFKPGLPRRMPWFEVHMIRAVHAAGVPVPEVFGEVTAEDYYRLSTRIEVLGPLVDRLTASALARGEDTLSYTHEVYRHALDEGDAPS